MDRRKEFFGMIAGVLGIAMLFTFVGYKVGERNAPAFRFELVPCGD